MTKRRITHWIVDEMVRALERDPDICLVLHKGLMPKTGYPRIKRDGRLMFLPRYLYVRMTGEELGQDVLIRQCKTTDCLNPFHAKRTRDRGAANRTHCRKGHPYQDNLPRPGDKRYRCHRCYEALLRRNRENEYGVGWCRKGHRLVGDNVYLYTRKRDGKQMRKCRPCAMEAQQRYRDRKVAEHG